MGLSLYFEPYVSLSFIHVCELPQHLRRQFEQIFHHHYLDIQMESVAHSFKSHSRILKFITPHNGLPTISAQAIQKRHFTSINICGFSLTKARKNSKKNFQNLIPSTNIFSRNAPLAYFIQFRYTYSGKAQTIQRFFKIFPILRSPELTEKEAAK